MGHPNLENKGYSESLPLAVNRNEVSPQLFQITGRYRNRRGRRRRRRWPFCRLRRRLQGRARIADSPQVPRSQSRFGRSTKGNGFKQEDDPAMRHQAFRTTALMLGVMFAAAPAARAGTITYGEVVRTAGAGGQLRPASEVRLRLVAQAGSTQSGAASPQDQQATGRQTTAPDGSSVTPASSDSTLSQTGGQIQTIDIGDVTGTVCDCGEIPPALKIPVGGFPWWTLAGIPLICVSGICAGGNHEVVPPTTPNPTPTTPTTPTSAVPEPVSLLLFGSGLLVV